MSYSIENFDVDPKKYWYWIGVAALLVGFTILFNILFTFSLMYLNRKLKTLAGGSDIECNKDTAVLEALQPPPNLESLSIEGCRSIILSPQWMVSLIHLKSLFLSRCRNCEYLPALGKLPRLQFLSIEKLESVKRVGNEFVGIETSSSSSSSPSLIAFPKLKTLRFGWMENWEEWEYKITAGDITIMPSLSQLYIDFCPKLKSLPDHLLHATTLDALYISWDCLSLQRVYKVEISGENGKTNISKRENREVQ